jgi:hypothetical protein
MEVSTGRSVRLGLVPLVVHKDSIACCAQMKEAMARIEQLQEQQKAATSARSGAGLRDHAV